MNQMALIIGKSLVICKPELLNEIEAKAKEYFIFPDYLRVILAEFQDSARVISAALLPKFFGQ
ncbi:hypothetical protein [Enterococcus sp. CWB-B31]|uniref:hypothetical protein n=1 Tax=Enterococcus sp. CWB-B31 TaxID=2885159 RepID=UPI001E386FB6|nr:hypothetical protein [Enterococcus sp. CWB-B31]MCB5955354.1 hypothetical protein [Enterococcus sp. CWB-B31]